VFEGAGGKSWEHYFAPKGAMQSWLLDTISEWGKLSNNNISGKVASWPSYYVHWEWYQ